MFSVASLSFAQSQDRERGPRGHQIDQEKKEMRGPKIPDLTEDQKEQLKELKVKHSKESLPLHNQVREQEARLTTLTTAEKINSSEVGRVIENIGDLRTELMKLRVSHMEEVKQILTEEQVVFLNNQISKKSGRKPARGR